MPKLVPDELNSEGVPAAVPVFCSPSTGSEMPLGLVPKPGFAEVDEALRAAIPACDPPKSNGELEGLEPKLVACTMG